MNPICDPTLCKEKAADIAFLFGALAGSACFVGMLFYPSFFNDTIRPESAKAELQLILAALFAWLAVSIFGGLAGAIPFFIARKLIRRYDSINIYSTLAYGILVAHMLKLLSKSNALELHFSIIPGAIAG
jgi:hypothetical protein